MSFERAVAAVQKLLDPQAAVTHDERLRDRLGHWRQFDVVIRGKVGGHDILGVIECKDFKRPVGTPEVNAFADKARNVRANLAVIASKRGFTQQALELAQHHGIGAISLLKTDPKEFGFYLPATYFALDYWWAQLSGLTVHVDDDASQIPPFSLEDVLWNERDITEWVTLELFTSYARESREGWHTLQVTFHQPVEFVIKGHSCRVAGFAIRALRTAKKKVKHIQWVGEAIYDWSKGAVVIPPGQSLVTEGWRTDLSDWDDYSGDLPALGQEKFVDLRFSVFRDPPALPWMPVKLRDHAQVNLEPEQAVNDS